MLIYRANKYIVNNILNLKYSFIGEEYYNERVINNDMGILNYETNMLVAIVHITEIKRISYYDFADSNGIKEDDFDMFERHVDYKQYGWYFTNVRVLKQPIELILNKEFVIYDIKLNEKELVFE